MYDKYTVGYNETLNDIADKFNTTKEELLSINNIYNEEYLRAGMDIAVPISNDYFTTYTVNSGDNLYAIARRYNINPTLLAALNGLNMDDYIYPNQKIMSP